LAQAVQLPLHPSARSCSRTRKGSGRHFSKMFGGYDCAATCRRQDAATSTVRVDPEAVSRQQKEIEAKRQEAERKKVEEAMRLKAEQEAEMLRQRQAAEERRLREEREAQERARLEQLEQERIERERLEQEKRDDERRIAEAKRAESERLEREEREKDVAAFLKQHGFSSVTSVKKSFMSSTYPIHKAAELGDVKIVAMLLKSGANPDQKNSSGKTAAQHAAKKDKKGSHSAVISVLSVPVTPAAPAAGGA